MNPALCLILTSELSHLFECRVPIPIGEVMSGQFHSVSVCKRDLCCQHVVSPVPEELVLLIHWIKDCAYVFR